MTDRFSLAGRVALVTGASRGLGFAMAEALAEQGATVILNARDEASVAANTGLVGTSQSLIPLRDATIRDGDVVVGYDKDMVTNAPPLEDDEEHKHYAPGIGLVQDGKLLLVQHGMANATK